MPKLAACVGLAAVAVSLACASPRSLREDTADQRARLESELILGMAGGEARARVRPLSLGVHHCGTRLTEDGACYAYVIPTGNTWYGFYSYLLLDLHFDSADTLIEYEVNESHTWL